ncbi:DEAH box polypeptide 37 [Magnaporthiopsis poae ATCC 64411]|uniref:RNA helicase n=1 Tax=Magnaporthiopsis poae (strain ATCC 64411 / 73-15) TaxID=644358 RepID=A0A0C4EG73_MAGP6|nr:DEAH box polypeptide 37 [Magnaporthiopsis poae ATCC 64411]
MRPKFVPRQRKRKVLDRERAAHKQQVSDEAQDGEAVAGGPNETAKLKAQLRSQGGTVSGKKAKRLEKYIEQKLKKDENRALLAQLAANKIDTSLFSSSRSIGHTKQTKRQALSQALKEERAGLPLGQAAREELLYEKRAEPELEDGDTEGEASTSEDADRPTTEAPKPSVAASVSGTMGSAAFAAGSGLKRPLEVDDDGRPVIQKRQKRGGVTSKIVIAQPPIQEFEDEDEEDEWGGFSTDNDSSKGSDDESIEGDQDEDLEQEGSESGSAEESREGADDGSDDDDDGDDSDDESDAGSDGGDGNNLEERRSAFKAWARAQRNEALGYKPAEPGSSVLEIPRPENFKPRPMEQDPLPLELQPTKNTDRKAFSVVVTRTPDIQEARLKLPVVSEEQRIMEAIHNNDIVVICGATGSGKTTQVPQFLFEAGYGCADSPTPGMIGITQPRRVAAVSMSNRVAQELGDHSKAVGYQIRFEGTVKTGTAVKFMTDGVLLREITQDLSLRKYSAIIVDEAHERSVNTDILIGMLSRIIKLRVEMAQEDPAVKPLKLIIMSATLRIEELTENPNLFPTPPPVLEVEGRQFPVTTHFARRTHHDYIEEAFNKISRGHKKLPPGGMLVFLTGQNEIAQLSKRLKLAFNGVNSVNGPQVRISTQEAPMEAEDVDFGDVDDTKPNDYVEEDEETDQGEDNEEEFKIEDEESGSGPTRMHVLPLYSLLPTKEQMRVFEPPPEGSRLVILATNVAETSLTIPGIRYVFDCGRSKERKYDQLTGVQSFEVGWISKASASQRAGRAGRTGPGHCYRLYSSAVYERDFPEFALPELLRTSLEGVVLQLKAMNLQHVVNFPFPTPPDRHNLVKAEKLLAYLSAVSSEGRVTQVGHTMSIFPLSPRFSRILLVGHQHDCLPYTIALVAALSAAEIFIPENQAIPALAAQEEGAVRTNEDVQAENRQANVRRAFNAVHKNFCSLDDKSDAIKMLQVLGEFAHEPTEQWCESHFVRFKVLKEAQKLRQQIVQLLKTNIPAFANITFQDKLDAPSAKQVKALKQMVAAGFIDRIAIRADKAPNPPKLWRKPRRAIDVPYIPLSPLAVGGKPVSDEEKLVYIHPESPLAHLSRDECPDYIVYSYLQKAASPPGDEEGGKIAKTRMHSLTDISGGVLAALAKGTPLISYGKPIKVVSDDGKSRECWVVPYLRAEGTGGMGWPLPMQKVKQRKMTGSWVVE